MKNFIKYQQAVEYLESLVNLRQQKDYLSDRSKPEIFIKRTKYFLKLLGNPEKGMKFIHVTGTAGKGTVATMVQEILQAADHKVGLFTSPFVTTTIEKIRVNDKYISPHQYSQLVEELKTYIDCAYRKSPYGGPSYFEIIFALALLYFKRQRCRWVILEAGMGGAYDATNIVARPEITAITNVGFDHMHLLGDTLDSIARDKAGIIKSGSHFFTTETRPFLRRLFINVCRKKKAHFHLVGCKADKPAGSHHPQNIALAEAITRHLGIIKKVMNKGLANTHLPARWEVVQRRPMVILDGAHSQPKITAVVDNLRKMKRGKLILVFALAANKKARDILKQIVPLADTIYFTRFQTVHRKAYVPSELADIAKSYKKKGAKYYSYLDPNQALDQAMRQAKNSDLVLITGSFFLAGDLRKRWISEEKILSGLGSF
ncbi:MAG: Mur ligase family protein [Patescibacteria group bacterium]